jgi:hypothetical protein
LGHLQKFLCTTEVMDGEATSITLKKHDHGILSLVVGIVLFNRVLVEPNNSVMQSSLFTRNIILQDISQFMNSYYFDEKVYLPTPPGVRPS